MNKTCTPFPSILGIVQSLTIGQRASRTPEELSSFLRSEIFPLFSPLSMELYLPVEGKSFMVPATGKQQTDPSLPTFLPRSILEGNERKSLEVVGETSGDSIEILEKSENHSHLIIPIKDDLETSGLLYLGTQDRCAFSSESISVVETVAAIIGSRLKSMQTILQLQTSMQALEHSEKVRSALFEISEKALTSADISSLYTNLHHIVGELLFARNFYIAIIEDVEESQYITFPYYVDEKDLQFQGLRMELNPDHYSITGHLVANRHPILLTPNNFTEFCTQNAVQCVGTPPHSWLGAPFYTDEIAGAVAVQSYGEVVYTERDKKLIAFVARHIGEALNRKQSLDALKKAKEMAELAEQKKSTFLANMSHEIRTPMNGILGLTDLILKNELEGNSRTYLEMVHSSADRLLKLINDILDFSKIEAGRLELEKTPFNLRQEIAGTIEILALGAARKNIGLTVDCDKSIPEQLFGDGNKLCQVLMNLVGNGIKFTEEGQVSVKVREAATSDPNRIVLNFSVRDTGIGIPEDKIDLVFEAFSQLGTTRDSNNPGTGLGLVIAAELVNLMGGKICVESTPGQGTTFYFTLEFRRGDEEITDEDLYLAQQDDATTAELKNLRILLVEDEYINRTLAIEVLNREGWSVICAENGREALKSLETASVDLVLMDVQMPELDGYATTRTLRRQERQIGGHIPVIAMTAYAIVGDKEKCLAAGMDGYISKPITPAQIRLEIAKVLKRYPPS